MVTPQEFIQQYWDSWTKEGYVTNYDFKQQLDSYFKDFPRHKPSVFEMHAHIRTYAARNDYSFFPDQSIRTLGQTLKVKKFIKGAFLQAKGVKPNILFRHQVDYINITFEDGYILIFQKDS